MKTNYHDIMSLIEHDPLWFDEHGVPRYVKFHPTEVANIYAKEVVLIQVGCQGCAAVFQVAMSLDREQFIQQGKLLHERIEQRELEYGDPPNTECCLAGRTMSSEPYLVLEYWYRQDGVGWSRHESFEVDITPDWVGKPDKLPLQIEVPKPEDDIFRCHKCGKPTHIDLLDAKDDGTGNFTIMECEKCYGPGYEKGCGADTKPALYVNHYECPQCCNEWQDTWSASCDDDCPACGTRHISPTHSENAD